MFHLFDFHPAHRAMPTLDHSKFLLAYAAKASPLSNDENAVSNEELGDIFAQVLARFEN